MTACVLNTGCICGKPVTVPCPTLHDFPRAMEAIEAAGLGWYPDIGHACSPECALVSASEAAMRQQRACAWPRTPARHASLFAEVAE